MYNKLHNIFFEGPNPQNGNFHRIVAYYKRNQFERSFNELVICNLITFAFKKVCNQKH